MWNPAACRTFASFPRQVLQDWFISLFTLALLLNYWYDYSSEHIECETIAVMRLICEILRERKFFFTVARDQ